MAFFDDLGRKISQSGQEAVKQGKSMATVAKQKSSISALQVKIKDMYAQIGEMYYKENKEHPDELYIDAITTIQKYEKEIEDAKLIIQNEKGIKVCPKCGKEISVAVPYCTVCGTRVEVSHAQETASESETSSVQEESKADSPMCPKCGARVPSGSQFCTTCGTKLGE